ncbi:MAG: carboxypeptidase-like regulatory domain-containing protein [Sphingobacteriaceae bacterium]|nr:carboxypeptidase-like regulatory domain-containing protein [Sphingobacteriaceae bacterium]
MKHLPFIFLVLLFLPAASISQTLTLKGKIKDEQKQHVPFASIYISNTSKGTSANSEGEFSIKLEKGNYELTFKAIGYSSRTEKVKLTEDQIITITLKSESFQLKDIVIKSNAEDPAYAIIRKAIRQRAIYHKQLKGYNADVYIKGLQRMYKAPKKILGIDVDANALGLDSNRRGIYYLSESESKLSFMPPNDFKEEMISSKVSGSSKAFSFNRATAMNVDFYANHQNWEGLSNRPVISPIADNALSYYNYKWLGTTTENGLEVNKIRVIPKRKAEPVFSGDIYIIEDSWRIHSANLSLTKSAGINFVDTLTIRQDFTPIAEKDWYPSLTRFDFRARIMGFDFGGYFIAVYRNYELGTKMDKKAFREVMRISKDVSKKDSVYWNQARPVPLTGEEETDYSKKQVLATKKESKPYLDSVDKAKNKFKFSRFLLLGGYTHRNRYNKETYRFNSILGSTYFNTVEGWGLDYGVSYFKPIDTVTNRYMNLSAKARYAFSAKRFNASLSGNLPFKFANIGFKMGSDMLDMNSQSPIPALANSYNSLVYERNYLKIYQKRFAELSLSRRLAGGLRGYISTEWSERKWLPNSTDYSWRDVENRSFSSNNPFSPSMETPLFAQHQAFILNLNLS